MEYKLQHYTITLTTEGPLFVGSGRTVGKKEYILDKRTQKAYIPDMAKMMAFFLQYKLSDSYENFLMKDCGDFGFWLRDNGITMQDCMPWIAYGLDSGDVEFGKSRDIQTFQKDPYGCPYVPGSSLKGALRTILLANELICRPDCFKAQRQAVLTETFRSSYGKKQITKTANSLEETAFHTLKLGNLLSSNALNDVLRSLRVGDSRPLSIDDLILCQKIDIATDGKVNRLPIMRECVKPGTVLSFPLVIDRQYCRYTPKELMDAAMMFINAYEKYFFKKFPTYNVLGGGNLYLGGGAGYVSKTVMYPLIQTRGLEKTGEILDCQFRKHGHKADLKKGASPHMLKCTMWNGKLYEMGACTMEID